MGRVAVELRLRVVSSQEGLIAGEIPFVSSTIAPMTPDELRQMIGKFPLWPPARLAGTGGLRMACHARLRAFPPQAVFGPAFMPG